MIEFIVEDRCTSCNKCVEVCSQDVFEAVPNGVPLIARQENCDSCRQCSLHCPESAIYVSLVAEARPNLNRQEIIDRGLLTKYAEWLGWERGQAPDGDRGGTAPAFVEAVRQMEVAEGPPADPVRRALFEARERNYI